jgi:hypothetical protein
MAATITIAALANMATRRRGDSDLSDSDMTLSKRGETRRDEPLHPRGPLVTLDTNG